MKITAETVIGSQRYGKSHFAMQLGQYIMDRLNKQYQTKRIDEYYESF